MARNIHAEIVGGLATYRLGSIDALVLGVRPSNWRWILWVTLPDRCLVLDGDLVHLFGLFHDSEPNPSQPWRQSYRTSPKAQLATAAASELHVESRLWGLRITFPNSERVSILGRPEVDKFEAAFRAQP